MKTNAIARIILWSTVIILLLGLLLWGLGGFRLPSRQVQNVPPETHVPQRTSETEENIDMPQETSVATEPGETSASVYKTAYTVLETVNVRTSPSKDSQVLTMLEAGQRVTLGVTETINSIQWGYVTEPVAGWVVMDYLQKDTAPADSITAAPAPDIDGSGMGYSSLPGRHTDISIEWALGNIFIQCADVERFQVREVNPNEDKIEQMVLDATGDKLIIRYADKNTWDLGVRIDETMAKDLYVLVPAGYALDSLEVDTASATLTVQDMTIGEMDFDGASGTCEFINCDIDELDLDTASGDITFQGKLNSLDCDAASANVSAVFENVPRSITMDSMSGDLDITLPENAGFTVKMDGMKRDFVSDFDYTVEDGAYRYGDGSCRIEMDAMSGDVYVRKSAAQKSTEPSHHK